MKYLNQLMLAAVVAGGSTAFAAAAPTTLTIGSGGEGGTYYPVVQQIADVCNSDTLVVQHRLGEDGKSIGGSDNNIRGILRNEIPGGLAQLDKAYLELQVNPDMPRVQALLPLHEEAIHVIVPAMVSVMTVEAEEGFFGTGIGSKEAVYEVQQNPLRDVAGLEGRTVVAWGGSLTTAKIVGQLGRLNLNVISAGNEGEAIQMIRDGQADAIIATVGYPASWIEELPKGEFKLLEVGKQLTEDVESVYGLSTVSYDNLGSTGQGTETLTVDALLFVWEYKTPEFVNALSELQSCVRENILRFQEEPGMHPAWRRINPSREMKWENVFTPKSVKSTSAVNPASD
ncbi:MAG: hypothetical protein WDZ93_02685 [Candidatus Paceibacterota bacterium]